MLDEKDKIRHYLKERIPLVQADARNAAKILYERIKKAYSDNDFKE